MSILTKGEGSFGLYNYINSCLRGCLHRQHEVK